MKVFKYLILCVCTAVLLNTSVTACAQENSDNHKIVTLTFYTDENTLFETIYCEGGCGITSHIPEKKGYRFLYWRYEKDGEMVIASRTDVFLEDTSFYACWEPAGIPADVVQNTKDSQKEIKQKQKMRAARIKAGIIRRKKPVISVKSAKNNAANIIIKASKFEKDGYEIRYSTSKSFKKAKTVTVESAKKKLSKKIKNLKKGKTYYIRVRAYKIFDPAAYEIAGEKETFYSKWSKVKKVTVSK
ncbi:MAG: hypothetical protein PUC12_08205 [Clostridiales bacterium]|nr:hypothetical protein [Clostridiales bacterium]